VRHVEIVTQRGALLELASNMSSRSFGSVVPLKACSVRSRAGMPRAVREANATLPGCGRAAYAHKARLVVIVEEGDQPHLGRGVVVGGMASERSAICLVLPLAEANTLFHQEIQRVVQHRIERNAPPLCVPV